jgi:hypothetical protein
MRSAGNPSEAYPDVKLKTDKSYEAFAKLLQTDSPSLDGRGLGGG